LQTAEPIKYDDSDTKSLNNNKVYKVPQGWLAGGWGCASAIQEVVKYFNDGKKVNLR